ncbi:ankyrin-2 [Penicillium brevicompactum]|uniref:ankyrin-2 n=1 Tax=Penicillium brevicompactum TaxID=5074 RepID=UPI00253FA527|nr:ankyrin-2 [Penicillium brevicompactum]KAJ5332998.1 ankyrin-2 [Penicillium brevicompactum]
MEAVGLAVGVIGLAGLFSSCLDVLERFDSWKDFNNDSRALALRFEADKLRFENWGQTVGIGQNDSSDYHHESLNDPRTLETVEGLLSVIREIGSDSEIRFPSGVSGPHARPAKGGLSSKATVHRPESRRRRLGWAMRDKAKRIAQVEQFAQLVDRLYILVPLTGSGNCGNTLGSTHVQTRRDVEKWLMGRHPPNELFSDFTDKRLDGTCEWILTEDSFINWSSSRISAVNAARLLWINGPAGVGKSTLCARLIKHLSDKTEEPIAHFFFSSDFETRADPFVAIRSWISQMATHPTAFRLIHEKRTKQHSQMATRADIIELLREICQSVHGCFFVLDGLDECTWRGGEEDSVTVFLETITRTIKHTSTRILVVSRNEPEIRHGLTNPIDGIIMFQHDISLQDVSSDIGLYSMSIVEKRLPRKTQAMKSGISQKMANGCNGQFLWLKMQEDSLRSWKNQKQLEDAIEKTPAGLEHLYERNWMKMARFPERERARAFALLRWTAFAFRPLSVRELTEALLIDESRNELLLDEMPDTIDDDYIDSEMANLCGSLLEIRSSQSEAHFGLRTVHLAHFSVKEYLLRNMPLDLTIPTFQPSTESIESVFFSRMCLRYATIPEVWSNTSPLCDDQIFGSFLDYAAGHWYEYSAMDNLNDSQAVSQMNSFFDSSNPTWHSWTHWMRGNDKTLKAMTLHGRGKSESPLFYAVLVRLPETVRHLIKEKGFTPNEQLCLGWTALTFACYRGDLKTTQVLLDAGANVTTADDDGWTPLHFASAAGYADLAKLLLTAGGGATTLAKQGCTPLELASYNSHHEIVQLLLRWNADQNPAPQHKWTHLQTVTDNSHPETAPVTPEIPEPISKCICPCVILPGVVFVKIFKLPASTSNSNTKKQRNRSPKFEPQPEADVEVDTDLDQKSSSSISSSRFELASAILKAEDVQDWSFEIDFESILLKLSQWTTNGTNDHLLSKLALHNPGHILDLISIYIMTRFKLLWVLNCDSQSGFDQFVKNLLFQQFIACSEY